MTPKGQGRDPDNFEADKAASTKEAKYMQPANSHVFVPVAIETAGTWNHLAVELTAVWRACCYFIILSVVFPDGDRSLLVSLSDLLAR